MSIYWKQDYSDQALDDLLPSRPFGESVNIRALLKSWIDQIQDLEDCAVLLVLFQRNTPTNLQGVQLDVLGKILGQPRWGRTDGNYRLLLNARIIANSSQGTVDPLLEVIFGILGIMPVYYQGGAASYMITLTLVDLLSDADHDAVIEFMRAMTPIGVEFELFEDPSKTSVDEFRFDTVDQGMDLGIFHARATTNG